MVPRRIHHNIILTRVQEFIDEHIMEPEDRYTSEETAREIIDNENLNNTHNATNIQDYTPRHTVSSILHFLWSIAGSSYWLSSAPRLIELFTMLHYFAYPHEESPINRIEEIERLAENVVESRPMNNPFSHHDIMQLTLEQLLALTRETGRVIYLQTAYFPQWIATTLQLYGRNMYGGPENVLEVAEDRYETATHRIGHCISHEYVYGGAAVRTAINLEEHRTVMNEFSPDAVTRAEEIINRARTARPDAENMNED